MQFKINNLQPLHKSSKNPDKPYQRELQEFIYLYSDKYKIIVPTNYLTDLASVPRCLWFILPPFGIDEVAFIVHDWLYLHQGFGVLSRKQCDKVMFRLQILTGASKIRARLMYYGVRLFGKIFWHFGNQELTEWEKKYASI